MRQIAVQRAFLPARQSAVNMESGMVDFNNLLLLAIERALAPPVVHRRSVFQPMRIVVVDPTLISQASLADEAQSEMPKVIPRALPPVADAGNFRERFQQRTVRGEILSDESGRLYEKLGRQIRPIHQLASDQFGEVMDLVPATPGKTLTIPASAKPNGVEGRITKPQSLKDDVNKGIDSEKSEFVPLRPEQNPQTKPLSHRKLFADPGQWRVLRWGEFKEILASQLAHPERLRDTYRLPCYVQVLETERAVSIEELAAVYKSESEHQTRLYFLTDQIAAKLNLVLPLRPAPSYQAQREPSILLAHERVFRLLVANDPTIDVTISKNKAQSHPTKAETPNDSKAGDSSALPAPLKKTIPNRFVNEWEFTISREEALYEMNAASTLGSVIHKFCRRLRLFKRSHELRRWQTLLAGKSVDEQLWAVRPPADMLANLLVREWAARTLELGGYDPQTMISEWEIFWRRRGL